MAMRAFDEAKHPRHPAGSERGGEWAQKNRSDWLDESRKRSPDGFPPGIFSPNDPVKFWPEKMGAYSGFRQDAPYGPFWKAAVDWDTGEEVAFWFTTTEGFPHHYAMITALRQAGVPRVLEPDFDWDTVSGYGAVVMDDGVKATPGDIAAMMARHRRDIRDANAMLDENQQDSALAAAGGEPSPEMLSLAAQTATDEALDRWEGVLAREYELLLIRAVDDAAARYKRLRVLLATAEQGSEHHGMVFPAWLPDWLTDSLTPEALVAAPWNEADHPRDPGGEGGGRWIPKGEVAADDGDVYDQLGMGDAAIVDGVRAALDEMPARLSHGDTGKHGFWLVNGRVVPWGEWGSLTADEKARAVGVHSHAPDGYSGADPFNVDAPQSQQEPLSVGDLKILHDMSTKGEAAPRSVVLQPNGTFDVFSYTTESNMRALHRKSHKTLQAEIFPDYAEAKRVWDEQRIPTVEQHRAALRNWAAANGFDYREGVRFADQADLDRWKSQHPTLATNMTAAADDVDDEQLRLAQAQAARQEAVDFVLAAAVNGAGVSFTIAPHLTAAIIAAAGKRVADDLGDAARKIVADTVVEATEEGWTVPQTADEMRAKVRDLAPHTATALARTDLIGLANAATMASARQAFRGMTIYKRWWTAHDDRVRPTHVEANGQTVEIDEPFRVGDARLDFPGDPRGPDEEVIQCRCVPLFLSAADSVAPVVEDPGPRLAVAASTYVESEHPRDPGGEGGGQWIKKGSSAAGGWTGPEIKTDPDMVAEVDERWYPGAEHVDDESGRYWYEPGSESVAAVAAEHGMTAAEYREAVAERAREDLETAYIAIRTPLAVVDEIVSDGRFKSQHETGESAGGTLDNGMRRYTEERMFGYPEDLPESGRPIYGYMSRPGHEQLETWTHGYGEIKWELKNDVLNRATVTGGDSFAGLYVPSPARNPEYSSFVAPVARQGESTDALRDGIFSGETVYVEAQVHGGVTLDDVAAIQIPKYLQRIAEEGSTLPSVNPHKAEEDAFSHAVKKLVERGVTVEYV